MTLDEITESTPDLMDDDRIRAFLADQGVGVLALADGDVPYVVPMSFGFDGGETLYFVFLLFGEESRKETLAERAGRASFLVYDAESAHEWRSVRLTGRLSEVVEGDAEWSKLRDAMENAWHPDLFSGANPMRGIAGYRFEVEDWTGIEHTR